MLKEHRILLKEQAQMLASDLEETYRGCSQAVIRASLQCLGKENEVLFNCSLPLCGGFAMSQETCGAVTAGALVLAAYSKKYSRWWDDHNKYDRERLVTAIYNSDKYVRECEELLGGTVNCKEITKVDFSKPEEVAKYMDSIEFYENCVAICGKIAGLVVEKLLIEDE